MTIKAVICAILSATLLLVCPVSAGPLHSVANELGADPEENVLAQEQKYTAGVLHGDLRLLTSVFADSFVDTSSNGIIRGKEQMLALFAAERPPRSIEERNRRITIYGNAAVVTVEFIAKGMDEGKPYTFHGRATDVWILQKGTWQCVAAHSSEIK